jgi:hypothetical protein
VMRRRFERLRHALVSLLVRTSNRHNSAQSFCIGIFGESVYTLLRNAVNVSNWYSPLLDIDICASGTAGKIYDTCYSMPTPDSSWAMTSTRLSRNSSFHGILPMKPI